VELFGFGSTEEGIWLAEDMEMEVSTHRGRVGGDFAGIRTAEGDQILSEGRSAKRKRSYGSSLRTINPPRRTSN
jgi:hypothetical protein